MWRAVTTRSLTSFSLLSQTRRRPLAYACLWRSIVHASGNTIVHIGLRVKLFAISDHIEKLVLMMRYLAVYTVSGVFSAASLLLLLLLLSFASIAPGGFIGWKLELEINHQRSGHAPLTGKPQQQLQFERWRFTNPKVHWFEGSLGRISQWPYGVYIWKAVQWRAVKMNKHLG